MDEMNNQENMEKTKFYRTVITFEVLSDDPIGDAGLDSITYEITEGGWSGMELDRKVEEVGAEKIAELLLAQGSDPAFLLGDDYLEVESTNE